MRQVEASIGATNMSVKLVVAALLFICVTASARSRADREAASHTGDNVGMKTKAKLAAKMLDAIRSGGDLWVYDQFVEGPDCLERARELVIERRAACSDPDESAFLTSVIRWLEKGDDDAPKV
jgi:hypothetical protein